LSAEWAGPYLAAGVYANSLTFWAFQLVRGHVTEAKVAYPAAKVASHDSSGAFKLMRGEVCGREWRFTLLTDDWPGGALNLMRESLETGDRFGTEWANRQRNVCGFHVDASGELRMRADADLGDVWVRPGPAAVAVQTDAIRVGAGGVH